MKVMDGVTVVTLDDCVYYLVGTNHVSQDSVDLVSKVIDEVKPDTVCVELDEKRYQKYINPSKWAETDIVAVIKQNNFTVLLSNIVYGAFQRKLAKDRGTVQAGELIEAVRSAEKNDAKLELIDRDIQITFKRMWRDLSFFQKPRLIMNFFSQFEDVDPDKLEDLLESDSFDTVFSELGEKYPTLHKDMIVERDMFMATKLAAVDGNVVVVVVGKAHVEGIKRKLEDRLVYDLEDLNSIPSKKIGSKFLEFLFPGILLVLFGLSFVSGVNVGISQVFKWFIWNGGLAALFTCFALPNPITVLVTFLMAPVGALSPVLSVGMFSALVEAILKKPTVSDFLTVQDDFGSIRSFYSNRLLRIGLVFMLANVGGAIGNIVGGIDIIKNLF